MPNRRTARDLHPSTILQSGNPKAFDRLPTSNLLRKQDPTHLCRFAQPERPNRTLPLLVIARNGLEIQFSGPAKLHQPSGIPLVDHVIVAERGCRSLAEWLATS